MGAVQKLATFVMLGLIGLATVLVWLVADEPNRRRAEAEEKEEVAIERGVETYLRYCVVCHGPAGEGYAEKLPDGSNARVGMPIGGNTEQRLINQTEDPVLREERENAIRKVLHDGRGLMPAWGVENGGELNDEQIEELVLMIQHEDWNHVYNEAIAEYGGYPTPQVAATQAPAAPSEGVAAAVSGYDQLYFEPAELTLAPGAAIELTNAGAGAHNFVVDALGILVDMPPGKTVQYTIPADAAPGTYEFYCNIPGHKEGGMVGTLTISADSAPPAASPSDAPPAGAPPPGEPTVPPAEPTQPPAEGAAPPAAAGAPMEVTVTGYDQLYWDPTDFAVAPGATVSLPNAGVALHNFAVDALGIDVDMPAGETVTAAIPADAAPGTYDYYCNVPGHKEGGMVGTLTVQ